MQCCHLQAKNCIRAVRIKCLLHHSSHQPSATSALFSAGHFTFTSSFSSIPVFLYPMVFLPFTVLLAFTTLRPAAGHGKIVAVVGNNGINATAFGIDVNIPLNGTRKNPFQFDTTIIRDREVASGKTEFCGRTTKGGNNNITENLSRMHALGSSNSMDACIYVDNIPP